MRRSSRPAVRWFAAGLTAAASAWSAVPSLAAAPVVGNSAYSYSTPAGEQFFALAVRATQLAEAHRPADRHVLLVDTSASQTGVHRERSLAVVEALLAALPAKATVSAFAVDVAAEPLTDGFLPVGEARTVVRDGLARRTPLGATDLAAGLNEALETFGTDAAGSVIYVGDGMSAANLLRSGELQPLTTALRERKIPVHAFAVGPNTDWRLLGVLAHQTGGWIDLDDDDAQADVSGRHLAEAATAPVVYPETLATDGSAKFLVGEALPPLRGDRETIFLGRGAVPTELRLTAGGEAAVVEINEAQTMEDRPVVRTLALAAERTNGLEMPAAGIDLLEAANAAVDRTIEGLAAAGTAAAKSNSIDQAKELLVSLENADPSGGATVQLRTALAQVEDVVPPPAAAPAAPQPAGGLIGAEIERQRILTQQMALETNDLIAQARQVRQSDPAGALNMLRRQENLVRLSSDIDPEARRQLLRRLGNEIIISENVREKNEQNTILRQERLAQIEAEQRMIDRMLLEEEQLHQLIERVRSLMDMGYHGDDAAFGEARTVANAAIDLRPGNGPATAALFTATAADQLNKMFRLRSLREDRFLETLYQTELSHVPFPDDPPIVYPAPEVWQALTERRAQYKSVSLESTSPAEEKIRAELLKPTQLAFPNTPLRTALEYLADSHGINIIVDETALADEGISIDDTVDVTLDGITLRSGLKILLEPYALTYVIEDEVMKITTQTIADEIQTVRVYPVGDLVIPIIFMGGGMGGMGGGMGGMGGGMGMGGGGFFSVPAPLIPQMDQPRPANARDVPQIPANERPIDDTEIQGLLDGVLSEQAATETAFGQAFASIRDLEGESAGKKK